MTETVMVTHNKVELALHRLREPVDPDGHPLMLLHGPKPPGRSDGSIFQRHPSSAWVAPIGTRYSSHSRDRRGFIFPRRAASSSTEPGRRTLVPAERRWSSHASVSCWRSRVRWCSGTSGQLRAEGMPSRLTSFSTRCGHASARWSISEPPLLWPSTGMGSGPRVAITAAASRTSASHE